MNVYAKINLSTLESLPNKFLPFLLGHESCTAPENCKREIDEIFSRNIRNAPSIKSDYVRDAGRWVIKGDRTDNLAESMLPDTNIHRVRKANKIRNFIIENHLEEHLAVPLKFVYWDTNSQKFFVIAEKLNLSEEVASPVSDFMKNLWSNNAQLGGQIAALAQNKPERALTPEQAEALAKLCFLGYTDLTYNNMYFTAEGQVAIIDTEPVKRGLKKAMNAIPIPWFQDKDTWLMGQAIVGTAKLKLVCSDPLALKAVEKIETEHFLWNLAKLVSKIAIVVLVLCVVPSLLAQLAIAAAVVTLLKVTIIGLASLKLMGLGISLLNSSGLLHFSRMGADYEGYGIGRISAMELAGAC